jgi:3-methyladenine DNA glycosylase AlkD
VNVDLDEIRGKLDSVSTPERAINEKRYLKSDLEFIGVPVPGIRKIARGISNDFADGDHDGVVQAVEQMWTEPVHEFRSPAARLLEFHVDVLTAADLPLVERMLDEAGSWVYVDLLSVHVAGPLVIRLPDLGAELDRWSTHENFWLRRSAMLALLVPLREGGGDWDRFTRYAEAMWEEKEFFVRKAIGWVLRDTAKKNPERVIRFVLPRAQRASGVTIREAVKYLPDAARDEILAVYRSRPKSPRQTPQRMS